MFDSNQKDKFYSFVLTYYRNDALVMMEKFSDEIAKVASQVSIDWTSTYRHVNLDGKKSKCVGLEKEDNGRIWVIGYLNTEITKYGNVIKYPVIRFQNFRKHFDGAEYFSGMKHLWIEFRRYQDGERARGCSVSKESLLAHRSKLESKRRLDERLVEQAVEKDWAWLLRLKKRVTPCPYFSSKGLDHIHEKIEMYTGYTTKGVVGQFSAVKAIDIKTGAFAGLQRIYEQQKIFRKGLNPSGTAWFSNEPINGDDIYILEAVADAALVFELSGKCSVAAWYADNISIVAVLLRDRYPMSRLIFIADNDQYSDPNKGVESCVAAINRIEDNYLLIVPQFEAEELMKKMKDLSDFFLSYGREKTLELISK